ncbi:CBO0543 family protein [Virgibacillus byunsanensis]|uniref:CBO0543 family protein n=1 Tax=Virgibacillus byunsanensis TaxID=570945 RepID=A0ABW3LR50_9BACI
MIFSIFNEVLETNEKLVQLRIEHYFENVIFSNQWWFLIGVTIAIWIIWAFLVDKSRVKTILFVGFITSFIALLLDDIGLSLALWTYPYLLTPFSNQFQPVDLAIVPVGYMLVYQYFIRWRLFLFVLTLVSIFAIFVVEPMFIKFDLYLQLRWEHWYSGPFYIVIGIFVKWLADKVSLK